MTESCYICGSCETVLWKERSLNRPLEPDDLRITDSRYGVTLALWKCSNCGFIFAASPEVEELTGLYERLTDPNYAETQDTRTLQMQWLLDRALRERPNAATLLDVGAGMGLMVKEARARGLEAVGIEPSQDLVESARALNGIDLLRGVYPHAALEGRTFDIVTLIDVIEHVADPVGLLRDCGRALAPDGLFVVVTPDVSSVPARVLGRRWWHFRLAHVGYFDRHSFDRAGDVAELDRLRRFRAKWFFRVRYLADRTAQYLPLGWLNRLAQRSAPLRWCYDRVIPLNLHDSFVVFLTRKLGTP